VRFAQIRLLVDDFAVSYRFYTQILGLTSKDGEEDPNEGPYAAFAVGGTDVAIFTRKFMDASIGAGHLPRGSADQRHARVEHAGSAPSGSGGHAHRVLSVRGRGLTEV
jgi:catechol 2,3-dioxygenase-like lactoylglutathione lyase family enzyme